MKDRTVVITGANAGIGRVAALELARRGARLVLAGRSEARTRPVLDELGALGGPEPVFVPLDLGALDSVRAAADRVLVVAPEIHVLVNNAGLVGKRGMRTESGFEPAFGVNHLGHYLFTRRLLERIVASAPGRIVNVASRAHQRAKDIDWEAVRRPTRSVTGMPEYQVSKLANVVFDKKLCRELEGTGVVTASLHPGVVATDIWRRVPRPLRWLLTRTMISDEEGAQTTIFCATSPVLEGRSGRYWDEHQEDTAPNPVSEDESLQDELWRRSATWVGL